MVQYTPLTFDASICFEQHYHGIEGDSASTAETYAIISSLSKLPVRQDIGGKCVTFLKLNEHPIRKSNKSFEVGYKLFFL